MTSSGVIRVVFPPSGMFVSFLLPPKCGEDCRNAALIAGANAVGFEVKGAFGNAGDCCAPNTGEEFRHVLSPGVGLISGCLLRNDVIAFKIAVRPPVDTFAILRD